MTRPSKPSSKLSAEDLSNTAFSFLVTEIGTGKVFAKIALQSKSLEKIERNRSRARLAHDTALRFFKQVPLSRSEREEVHGRLQDLKADLNRLGEAV